MELVCPGCHAVNRVPDDRLSDQPKCGKCGAALLPGKPVELGSSGPSNHVRSVVWQFLEPEREKSGLLAFRFVAPPFAIVKKNQQKAGVDAKKLELSAAE